MEKGRAGTKKEDERLTELRRERLEDKERIK
jgi:hypothetical protein